MVYENYYKALGKLLYAVAKADGVVSKKEQETVRTVVKKHLLDLEDSTDNFGSDLAYLTEFEFETYYDQDFTSAEALEEFIAYYTTNKKHIAKPLSKLALLIAVDVAKAVHGINKAENEIINKLADVLV